VKKAYDTLDRDRTLLILEWYRVGRKVWRVLCNFWKGMDFHDRVDTEANLFLWAVGSLRAILSCPRFDVTCDSRNLSHLLGMKTLRKL
jgi:hypothetical protein